jgi:hypothetical protein
MATAQEPPPKNVSFSPGEAGGVMLHRHGGADSYDLGLTAKAILKTFEQTIADRESHALLVWPQPTHGISVIHALAALARISGATLIVLRPCSFRGTETPVRPRKHFW